MRTLCTVTVALLLAGLAAAQHPCNMGQPALGSWITCPCINFLGQGYAPLNLGLSGQGRIGTVQRYDVSPYDSQRPLFLVLGFPASTPIPVPPGLLVCPGENYANVPTLHVEPAAIFAFMPPITTLLVYWLFVPSELAFVGTPIHAQAINLLSGLGSSPAVASAVLGFTIQS